VRRQMTKAYPHLISRAISPGSFLSGSAEARKWHDGFQRHQQHEKAIVAMSTEGSEIFIMEKLRVEHEEIQKRMLKGTASGFSGEGHCCIFVLHNAT